MKCRRLRLGVLVAAALAGAPAVVGTQSFADGAVVIRLYNNFGVPFPELTAARQTAETLLRTAGVEPSWRECRLATGSMSPSTVACDDVLRPSEVIVRILGIAASDDSNALGNSYVDAESKTGSLSTVYADRVHAIAARTRVNRGVLLGRAVAHEVAHLLLGSKTHSESGLMRAHWPDYMLQRNFNQDWVFSQDEARQMQEGVLARSGKP